MVTKELLDYIYEARSKGLSDEEISSELLHAGWRADDVTAAFEQVIMGTPAITVDPDLGNTASLADSSSLAESNNLIDSNNLTDSSADLSRQKTLPKTLIVGLVLVLVAVVAGFWLMTSASRSGSISLGEQQPESMLEAADQGISPSDSVEIEAAEPVPTLTPVVGDDCGSSLECLAEAAATCKLAGINYSGRLNLRGVVYDTPALVSIDPATAGNCRISVSIDDSSDDYVKGSSPLSEIITEDESLSCIYETEELSSLLESWQEGDFSRGLDAGSSGFSKEVCQVVSLLPPPDSTGP